LPEYGATQSGKVVVLGVTLGLVMPENVRFACTALALSPAEAVAYTFTVMVLPVVYEPLLGVSEKLASPAAKAAGAIAVTGSATAVSNTANRVHPLLRR
jgi:hypothetical protein